MKQERGKEMNWKNKEVENWNDKDKSDYEKYKENKNKETLNLLNKIGATIEPSSNPNLNQSLFGSTNILGARKANKKKMIDTTNAQIRRPSEVIKGYRAIIKNTHENTTPKDFGEDCSVETWLLISDISTLRHNYGPFYNALA